jgi:hypothetical protein
MTPRNLILVLLAGAVGCTFSEGVPFATLDAATLEARLVTLPGRDAGDGWQKLNTDYQVRFDTFTLDTSTLVLQKRTAGGGGGGGGTFDPANPPPRYSNCHSGHCHRDDGALVDYEDIQAELSGGGSGPTTVSIFSFPVDRVDLLAGTRRELPCEPCDLPEGGVDRARLSLVRLSLRGHIRDGRSMSRLPGEVPFSLELPLDAATLDALDGTIDVPADRAHEPRVSLVLMLNPTAAILDTIDWAPLARTGTGIDLAAEANQEARKVVLQHLAEVELGEEVTRTSH